MYDVETSTSATPVTQAMSTTQATSTTSALKYDGQLPTDFGDRMSVYLTVVAAAASVGADVFVYWHDNPNDPGQSTDTRMAYGAVQSYIL